MYDDNLKVVVSYKCVIMSYDNCIIVTSGNCVIL